MEPLFHGTRQMGREPIGPTSVREYAQLIVDGQTVAIELEPGDATYYCLIIVPAWTEGLLGRLDRYGIPRHACMDYLFVTRVDDDGGKTFIFNRFNSGEHTLEDHIKNPWSQRLLSWWLRGLWEDINDIIVNQT